MPSTLSVQTHPLANYDGMRVTREEYLDLPHDGNRYDMIDGVLHMVPSADFEHGVIQLEFASAVKHYLRANLVGIATLETDIFLPDGGDVLRPDLSYVSAARTHIIKRHIHGAPDLVAEILSDSTRERDLGVKADRYLACGVREYWIVDRDALTLHLWINRGDHWEKHAEGTLHSEVLPGFTLTAKSFFG